MSFEAILTIEDKEFKVFTFNYNCKRDHDRTGRPSSALLGIRIEMVIEAKPESVLLHLWAYTAYEMKKGKVTFMQRNNFQKQAEIEFQDSYIADITTDFSHQGEVPMTERLIIFANKITYSSEGFYAENEMDWPS